MIAAVNKRKSKAEATRLLRAERRSKGLCTLCGEPSGGMSLCQAHREVDQIRKRVRRGHEIARRTVDTSEVILPADRKLCGEQVIAEAREAKSVRRRRPTEDGNADDLALALEPEQWIEWQKLRNNARDRKAKLDKIHQKKFRVPIVDGPDILTIHEEGGV